MKRTRLKKKANKTGKKEDLERYKKQRNIIVNMNRKAKRDFYNSVNVNTIDNDRKFWKAVKPMFSNGNPMGDKIVLIKDYNIISDDKFIAESFTSHFVTIADSLGLDPAFKDVGIHKAPKHYCHKDHPSIIAIKRKVTAGHKFEFRFVTFLNVMNRIEALEANKPSIDNLPMKIIQEAKEVICPYLADHINAAMDNCVFPEKLKEAEVRAIYKLGGYISNNEL